MSQPGAAGEDPRDTELHRASRLGKSVSVQKLLISPQTEVNAANEAGATPLLVACQEGHVGVVSKLLGDPKVDPNIADKSGLTPLAAASQQGHLGVVHLLAHDPRVVIDKVNQEGRSLIEQAFCDGQPEIGKLLLEARADRTKVTVKADFETVKGIELAMKSPPRWLAIVTRLLLDPDTREQALQAQLLSALLKMTEQPALDPRLLVLLMQNVVLLYSVSELKRPLAAERSNSRLAAAFTRGTPEAKQAALLIKEFITTNVLGKDLAKRNAALDFLMEAAAVVELRPMLVNYGVKDLVLPFAGNPASDANFVAVLIIALLSASDVSATTQEGTNPAPPGVIKRMIEAITRIANTQETHTPTVGKYSAYVKLLLVAMRSLATNESNLKELKSLDFIAVLKTLFMNRRVDLFRNHLDNLEEAAYILWSLSFDKECREKLIEAGAIGIIKAFPTTHEGVKRGIQGALWNLEGGGHASVDAGTGAGHIMISYSWGQKERMRELAGILKDQGFRIWIDVDEMEGSVLERMAEAVEGAAAIVIGLSSSYKDSQACRTEAEYGYKLKKTMLFVVAEEGYVAKGWLGATLGNQLWYSPFASSASLDEFVKALAKKVPAETTQQPPQQQKQPQPQPQSQQQIQRKTSLASVGRLPSTDDVVVPESAEPLPAALLAPEKVPTWGVTEVCRWLRMKKLERLLVPFVAHEVTGLALLGLGCDRNAGSTVSVLRSFGVEQGGVALEFHYHLQELLRSK